MITEYEAAESLRQSQLVEQRTNLFRAYAAASPHLLLAGAVWTVGYFGMGISRPEQWGLIWLPLTVAALLGSFVIALRGNRPKATDPTPWIASVGAVTGASRVLWGMGAAMIFIVVTYLLFRPAELLPYIVFPAFVLAFVYALVGSMGATRFVWIGACVFAVTEVGLLIAPNLITYFIAAGGGGGLIAGGLWLRRA